MIDDFRVRRNLVLNLLNDIKGFNTNIPEGAFYVFPDISYYFGKTLNGIKINNATDFSIYRSRTHSTFRFTSFAC